MKILIIGGNRFVGLRLVHMLDKLKGCEVHVLNRTGQVAHSRSAVVHKGDRGNLAQTHLDRDWDLIYDFACFNRRDAESALNYFTSVRSYIFISTVSVYNLGVDLKEAAFDPATWDLATSLTADAHGGLAYQHGKRQAETVFTRSAGFPVLSIRFPVILGPDDYTRRLEFHIERAKAGETIYAEKPDARFSMLHAGDAADFLLWARDGKFNGPLNVASPETMSVRGLCAQIELITGKRANILPTPKGASEGISPYCPDGDWFMNCDRMRLMGFKTKSIPEWLPELIGLPETHGRKGFVH